MTNIGRQMLLLSAAVLGCSGVGAVYNSNVEVPFADHIKRTGGSHLVKVGAEYEYGFASDSGFDSGSNSVNAARVYAPRESARNMLLDPNYKQTFPTSGYDTTLFPEGLDWSLWGMPLGLGTSWGDMTVAAKQRQTALTLWGRVTVDYGTVPGQFFLSMAVPFKSVEVSDVTWTDLTDPTADGARNPVWISNLTSKLADYVKAVGNLDINKWSKRGMGDTEVYFGWSNSFGHSDGSIRKVDVHASLGLSLPTSTQRNYDYAFSTPFGNDGSWGIPFRIGYDVSLGDDLKLGSCLDVLWLSTFSKVRRLKTDATQSDYLVLTTGNVTTTPGIKWKATTSATYKLSESFRISAAYKYVRHEEDTLSCPPTGYDLTVINSLQSLKAWSAQDITVKAHFEGAFGSTEEDDREGNSVVMSVFYTMPVAGMRTVKNSVAGVELYFAF
jgi:hypothetical protein